MRTTVTLDPDVAAVVRRAMQQRGKTFKEVVNEALRTGLSQRPAEPFQTPTFNTGKPLVDLDKALKISSILEDDALRRKIRVGK